jgi:hypothetical protein
MERSMSPVDIGSSTPSAAMPKAPPIAPEVATAILWSLSDDDRRALPPRLRTASSSAFMSAFEVASCTPFCQRAGMRAMPLSSGAPASAESFAARPGCSRMRFAPRSSSSSSLESAISR